MQKSITIQKHPQLSNSSNYELLRQEGLKAIEQLGSRWWTDYNIHDPGITQMELLCYAITDLGYRTSLDIKDLLAVPFNEIPDHNRQAFYTAREILTTNPWTVNDFRKLLIDINGVKNAWLACKKCACEDLYIYANCAKSVLQYEPTEHKITIKGLYDVLVEFEDEEGMGNLNSGKIKYNFTFAPLSGLTTAAIEMRLPSWKMIDSKEIISKHFEGDEITWQKFLQLVHPGSLVTNVDVVDIFISGTKDDDVDIPPNELASRLRKPVYATFKVKYIPSVDITTPLIPAEIVFNDVPLTVWFKSDSDRKAVTIDDLKAAISDATSSGIISKYIDKIRRANDIIATTKQVLHSHRNLDEDYCTIKAVETEDIGICADMEVEPHVDIEAILAEAYYLIDQYFSPDIKFYSLTQLLEAGKTVDEIFEGPKLNNGFVDDVQLESTNLKRILYTSDIINLLMDIPGVKAVKNFALTLYDDEGYQVKSEPWSLEVSYNHQPRLYAEASRFLVFKNGLPFLPDKLELADTLQVVIGNNAQPKFSATENDLPVPEGVYYDLTGYYPLQYSLPLTYGVGYEGLPATASAKRKAQAKQLKAYLLFYEQLLVNYMEQLAHVKDLFAVDPTVQHSYFSRLLTSKEIKGLDEIINGLNSTNLQQLEESETVFLDRRNRFLDHLLARFAEQFNDYALMLYSYSQSKEVADDKLIKDKIAFLKDYPFMSYNKARSFNYKDPGEVCHPENIAGLTMRIRRLLGIPEFTGYFDLFDEYDSNGVFLHRRWRLTGDNGQVYLISNNTFTDPLRSQSEEKAKAEISIVRQFIADVARFETIQTTDWFLNLLDDTANILATHPQTFASQALAEIARDQIITFAEKAFAAEKVFIVEHLLLRPRNKPGGPLPDGDPLLNICIGPDCNVCGEEDPYSFRLTIVLNGEEGLANNGIAFRRFAEQTIRKEIPAHLALKVCWVSTEQLQEFEEKWCAWLTELSKPAPDTVQLSNLLKELLTLFAALKNIYPKASLHDCADGDDENRVFLNQTII
ncbi:hypothetical protein FAM09_00290 [Niastella caeni]|uniref:Uncharacterized protein n=1 Tax=Niastella caeni TaxID=2569763 RepID=A0A4S8I0B0_9BACT|nr:hypothetical protein [Niastella caeni]THU40589.1 hypothetical protein FAM09_00290 [Niastella caeni]